MPYTARMYATTGEIPADAWNAVQREYGEAFTDLSFLEIVESTLGEHFRFAAVIVFDEGERAAGIFCVSTCRLDATTLAAAPIRKLAEYIRRVWPGFLHFTLVVCGLPVTVPQLKPVVRPDADLAEVMRLMHETACAFAERHRATAVLLGDFAADAGPEIDGLSSRGYRRFPSPPAYYLELRQRSIPEYLAAMRHDYRQNLNRDLRKFDERRVCVEIVTESDKQADPMGQEFYDLYLQLLERVDFHLVTLPREFFNRLTRLYYHEIDLLRVRIDGRPAAVAMGLVLRDTYWFILIAVDPELNRRYGLYPGLFVNRIGRAMSLGMKRIDFGTTADEFKLRIGGTPRPMRIYLKVRGLLRFPFAWVSRLLLRDTPDVKPYRVFRESGAGPAAKGAKADGNGELRASAPAEPDSMGNSPVTETDDAR